MKTLKTIAAITLSLVTFLNSNAQTNNVGIGTTSPDASAILELNSTSKGFLPPRMTLLEIFSIPAPIEGLVVYNTSTKTLNVFNGTNWMDLNGITFVLTVQLRLDVGETPKQIFDSGIPLDSLYGKSYEGGLLAYLNTTDGTGLIAAPTDQSTFAVLWCSTNDITGADGTAIGTGNQNTIDIVAECSSPSLAASICANYSITASGVTYSDWFLPSKDELNELWKNLADSDGNGSNGGLADPNNLGGFSTDYYWSSSEQAKESAYYQRFFNGFQGPQYSGDGYRVRAVRAF
jgi:hypothetical protein